MQFLESKVKEGFELPIRVANRGVIWQRIPVIKKRFRHTLDVLDIKKCVLRQFEGKDGDDRVGTFHLLGTTYSEEKILIMPPNGIIMSTKRGSGNVKNLQAIVEEIARRNAAKLFAIIDMSKNYLKTMEEIEEAGYIRSGVNMRANLIVLNFGTSPELHGIFTKSKFNAL